jgi:predicted amidohydrolase YtcJ
MHEVSPGHVVAWRRPHEIRARNPWCCCSRAARRSGRRARPDPVNAKVYTVDDAQPAAEAVAIRGDRIVAVGSDAAVRALAGSATRSIDLQGQMVLPGFNDAHTHFGNAVEWHFQVMLMHVEDQAAMLRGLREATARVPKGMWITGGDWGTVAAGRAARQGNPGFVAFTPDLKAIDAVSPDHPVLFRRHDHSYFINSAGMRLLRFDRAVADPATGRYGRAAGEFTGMLFGSVGELIEKQLPPMSHAQALIGARGVAGSLNRVGITSIQDMARVEAVSRQQLYHAHIERSFTDHRIFSDLRDRGELTLRVYAILPLRQLPGLAAAGIRPRTGDSWLSYGALKDLADSGYMLEPYADNPNYRAGWTFRMVDEAFEERQMVEGDRAWLRHDHARHRRPGAAPHARLVRGRDPRQRRARRPAPAIIHVWYAHPDDLKRAGAWGWPPDVQPPRCWSARGDRALARPRARKMGERLPHHDRQRRAPDAELGFPRHLQSPVDGGVQPAGEHLHGGDAQDLHGKPAGGFHPEQRITLDEAIRAVTINPAWASHEENLKGSITWASWPTWWCCRRTSAASRRRTC